MQQKRPYTTSHQVKELSFIQVHLQLQHLHQKLETVWYHSIPTQTWNNFWITFQYKRRISCLILMNKIKRNVQFVVSSHLLKMWWQVKFTTIFYSFFIKTLIICWNDCSSVAMLTLNINCGNQSSSTSAQFFSIFRFSATNFDQMIKTNYIHNFYS